MKYTAKTNIGKRANNEDNYRIPAESEVPLLFAVADGMGGHAAGETASRTIVERLAAEVANGAFTGVDQQQRVATLMRIFSEANHSVFLAAQGNASLAGMGSTLVGALILNSEAYLAANVGDSRLYRLEKATGTLRRVTIDHSLVEQLVQCGIITEQEARVHPQRNIITRAMGISASVDTDIFECAWAEGDILLLCSDGLSGPLTDEDICEILLSGNELDAVADTLIQSALDAGGTDNITLILVQNDGSDAAC